MMAVQQQEITVFLNHGRSMERPEENIGHPGVTAPCGVYSTSDGYLMLAMFPCPKLGAILKVDWLAQYDTNEKMFAERDEIHRRLSQHFAAHSTAYWMDLLAAHDVWCAPVQRYADLEHDPQVAHKHLIWEVPISDGSAKYRTVGSPLTLSSSFVGVRRSAPRSGEHTTEFVRRDIWKNDSDK